MVLRKIVLVISVSNGRSYVTVKVVSAVVRAEEIAPCVPNVLVNERILTQACIQIYVCITVLCLAVWDSRCIGVVSVRSIVTTIGT